MNIPPTWLDKVDALGVGLISQLLSQAMMILQKKHITLKQSLLRFILAGGLAVLCYIAVPQGPLQGIIGWFCGFLAYPICKFIGDNSDKIIKKMAEFFISKNI